jgi:hypothetical protein
MDVLESTPQGAAYRSAAYAFYQSIKGVFSEVESLCLSLEWAMKRLNPLDSYPRHDQPIDDDMWQALADSHPRSTLFMSVLRDLRLSNRSLESASSAAKGSFRGDAKNRVEGLMARHLATAEHLLQVLEDLADELETSRLPYQIRQTELSPLARSASYIADSLVSVYRTTDKDAIDADLLQALLRQQQLALQVRAVLGRLRDNPSQKVAEHLRTCLAKMTAVRHGLLLIMRDVANRSQMRFITRSGQDIDFKQTLIAYQYGLSQ